MHHTIQIKRRVSATESEVLGATRGPYDEISEWAITPVTPYRHAYGFTQGRLKAPQ